jgi:hypothetical protein
MGHAYKILIGNPERSQLVMHLREMWCVWIGFVWFRTGISGKLL